MTKTSRQKQAKKSGAAASSGGQKSGNEDQDEMPDMFLPEPWRGGLCLSLEPFRNPVGCLNDAWASLANQNWLNMAAVFCCWLGVATVDLWSPWSWPGWGWLGQTLIFVIGWAIWHFQLDLDSIKSFSVSDLTEMMPSSPKTVQDSQRPSGVSPATVWCARLGLEEEPAIESNEGSVEHANEQCTDDLDCDSTPQQRASGQLQAARTKGNADDIEEACKRAEAAGLVSFEIDIARAELKWHREKEAENKPADEREVVAAAARGRQEESLSPDRSSRSKEERAEAKRLKAARKAASAPPASTPPTGSSDGERREDGCNQSPSPSDSSGSIAEKRLKFEAAREELLEAEMHEKRLRFEAAQRELSAAANELSTYSYASDDTDVAKRRTTWQPYEQISQQQVVVPLDQQADYSGFQFIAVPVSNNNTPMPALPQGAIPIGIQSFSGDKPAVEVLPASETKLGTTPLQSGAALYTPPIPPPNFEPTVHTNAVDTDTAAGANARWKIVDPRTGKEVGSRLHPSDGECTEPQKQAHFEEHLGGSGAGGAHFESVAAAEKAVAAERARVAGQVVAAGSWAAMSEATEAVAAERARVAGQVVAAGSWAAASEATEARQQMPSKKFRIINPITGEEVAPRVK